MVHIIFEDGEDTPSSRLISNCSSNIHFSNGNKFLYKKSLEYKDSDTILIYVDVVPDNEYTIGKYYSLIDKRDKKQRNNVFIYPIICIEYYICIMLNDFGMLTVNNGTEELIDCLVKNFDYKRISDTHHKSLEKLYKFIVSGNIPQCKVNKASKKTESIKGKFYADNCPCSRCIDECKGKVIDKLFKAEYLYTRLPLFKVFDSKHSKILNTYGIHYKQADYKKQLEKCNALYRTVCESMGRRVIEIERF